jgi:hypothetical protein
VILRELVDGEATVVNGGTNGTAWLSLMFTVSKVTVSGQHVDLGEYVFD